MRVTSQLESRMREIRKSGSEGGGSEFNHFSLPLSSRSPDPVFFFVRLRSLRSFVVNSVVSVRSGNSTTPSAYNRTMAGAQGALRISSADVKAEAAAAGFDLCGIAPATSFPELRFLREWLDARLCRRDALPAAHGGAARRRARRPALGALRHLARHRLQHGSPVLDRERRSRRAPAIARYAWGDDYHVVIERAAASS